MLPPPPQVHRRTCLTQDPDTSSSSPPPSSSGGVFSQDSLLSKQGASVFSEPSRRRMRLPG